MDTMTSTAAFELIHELTAAERALMTDFTEAAQARKDAATIALVNALTGVQR